MDLETKFATIEAEAVTEEGIISGYASRFNIEDQGGDVVVPGAYLKSLSIRHPLMLWSHNIDQPIGKWLKIEEDAIGLRVEGQIALSTVKGRETYDLLKMGALKGLSIGYRTLKSELQGTARLLKEVALYEISVTPLPMQDEAGIDAVKSIAAIILATKSGDFSSYKRAVESAMRDAGFPAWQAKALAALAPQILSDGQRDASASETARLIKDSFKL
ncbi:HK97 family phage prohead protease [Ochrobactrum sp. GRS2]|nr:HK97 family phage prohead protease [Ochrobactrum sp. GRS2]